MSLNAAERADLQAAWQKMTWPQRLRYLWGYYKWPALVVALLLAAAVSYTHHVVTQKKPLLYLGAANVALGDDLLAALDAGFVTAQGQDPKRAEVTLYRDLYLTQDASDANHEYAYASRLKVMASVTAQELDLVLMNREAYDVLSHQGYLLPLPDLLGQDPALAARLDDCLCENTVILEDNSIEVDLGEAEEYIAETEQAVNGIDAAGFAKFAGAGFSGDVYLGVIGNTPRGDMVLAYIDWLTS